MKIEINVRKSYLYIIGLLILATIVIAWNSNDPEFHGHTFDEIKVYCSVVGGPGQSDVDTATCPEDAVRTGGGCTATGTAVEATYAISNGWGCECLGSGCIAHAHAICCSTFGSV